MDRRVLVSDRENLESTTTVDLGPRTSPFGSRPLPRGGVESVRPWYTHRWILMCWVGVHDLGVGEGLVAVPGESGYGTGEDEG